LISSSTKLLGLIGYPLGHSISFYIHNVSFQASSIDAIYLNIPILPDNFNQAFSGLKYLPIWGLNVTVPFKEKVIEFLDDLSPTAKMLKAVNTIYKDEKNRWLGDNTDLPGFLYTLKELTLPQDVIYLVLGAGGACRAVLYALIEYGVREIFLTNRTYERAERLAEEIWSNKGINIKLLPWDEKEKIKDKFILINTTSLGLDGKSNPWDSSLDKAVFVYDLIYNPPLTPLLIMAKENNIPYKNGLDMLIYQAAFSWERWFGFMGPVEVMKKEAEKIICVS